MKPKPDTLIRELRYIAASPPREYGGFHAQTVATARAALREIRQLRRRMKESPVDRETTL